MRRNTIIVFRRICFDVRPFCIANKRERVYSRPQQSRQYMDTHKGIGAYFGALLAIYAALTQPSVVAQVPGKAGQVLGALGAASPLVTAAIGVVGSVIAARSMPPGSPKAGE